MTALLRAELLRMTSRRLFRGFAVAVLAIIALQVTVAFLTSSKDPNAGLQEARNEVRFCAEERARTAQEIGERAVEGWQCPTLEEAMQSYDERFRYGPMMADAFKGIGVMLLTLGLVCGASFVGAEWGSGTMTTLLTWEPRRGRVLVAKYLACVAIVATGAAVLYLIVALVFLPVAALRGTTEGVDGSFWWTSLGTMARGIGLSLFGTTLGVALATVVRHTAGAIGVGLFYGSVVDVLLGLWLNQRFEEWTFRINIARLMGDFDEGMPQAGLQTLSITKPVVRLALYGVAVMLVAYAMLRRRDVT